MKREFLTITFIGFFIFISHLGFSQTSISGVINLYSEVDSIYPTKDTVEVANPSLFNANDTVMIYQAKGAVAETDTSSQEYLFGNIRSKNDMNNAGKYEIILVQKVIGDTIIFKATLNNDYDEQDIVQLIRVPSYKKASVDGELSCDPWDGAKGGVLVLMVGDTLIMNDKIDVTGKGFKGALPFESNGNCASTNPDIYDFYYFHENTPTISAGFKGEGIAEYNPMYAKGLGRWANGGGGGNGRFSGGGGGANFSQGGDGGQEDTITCNTPNYSGTFWYGVGGLDGFGLGNVGTATTNDSTIFLGGGGGSGTYTTGFTASTGGNGGGIVIIIAKALKSNGDSVIARGASVVDVTTASAAGGGGGGTVVFDIESVVGSSEVHVTGGNGGRVQHDGDAGPGGGGGGGVIFWNTTQPGNVGFDIFGGKAGYVQDLYPADVRNEASPGVAGSQKINVDVPLTGFLFNWISDDQEICMNTAPKLISGTNPRGGYGNFQIQWKESPDGSLWSDIIGATDKDYQPPALTDTIFYQRIVVSKLNASDSIVDKGNILRITVLDSIKVNEISGFDLVKCIGNESDSIIGTTATFGGLSAPYTYIWEASTDFNNWNTLTPKNDTVCYPGTITDTTYVRRIVESGACLDTTPIITIVGLPEIANNTIADQEICMLDVPMELSGGTLTGGLGAGTYSYKWIESDDGVSWTDTLVGENNSSYQPLALADTIYYKRIVTSDDCFDESNIITIDVLDSIRNNIIDIDGGLPFTCFNTEPKTFLGTNPIGGNGVYTYQWLDSISGGNLDIVPGATNINYNSIALADTTYFRRVVNSSACTDTSEFLKIGIWDLPVGTINNFTDTLCSEDYINLEFSLNEIDNNNYSIYFSNNLGELHDTTLTSYGNFTKQVQPIISNQKQTLIYSIDSIINSNGCYSVSMDGADTVVVYGLPLADAGITDTVQVCDLSYQLASVFTTSFGDGVWYDALNQIRGLDPVLVAEDIDSVYKYVLHRTNEDRCLQKDSIYVWMYEDLQNVTILRPDDSIASDLVDTILFNAGNINQLHVKGIYDSTSFPAEVVRVWKSDVIWDIDDKNDISATYHWNTDTVPESFNVIWDVKKGVCDAITISRKVKLDDKVFVSSGFSPNGDGANDKLLVYGFNENIKNVLFIYNRWGTEVKKLEFPTDEPENSIKEGWDGTNDKGNELPEDTYYYVLYKYKSNGTEVDRGYIVIKRD